MNTLYSWSYSPISSKPPGDISLGPSRRPFSRSSVPRTSCCEPPTAPTHCAGATRRLLGCAPTGSQPKPRPRVLMRGPSAGLSAAAPYSFLSCYRCRPSLTSVCAAVRHFGLGNSAAGRGQTFGEKQSRQAVEKAAWTEALSGLHHGGGGTSCRLPPCAVWLAGG